MAKKGEWTGAFDNLPKIAKVVLQIVISWAINLGGIYRILRYCETQNIVTLVAGILALIPGPGTVFWIIDIITLILDDKITVLAD